jgi:hypothetical protein
MERQSTPYGPLEVLTDDEALERIDASGILHCIPWPGAFATLLAPETGGTDYAIQLKVNGKVEYVDADPDVRRLLGRRGGRLGPSKEK